MLRQKALQRSYKRPDVTASSPVTIVRSLFHRVNPRQDWCGPLLQIGPDDRQQIIGDLLGSPSSTEVLPDVLLHHLGHQAVDGTAAGGEQLQRVSTFLFLIGQGALHRFDLATDFLHPAKQLVAVAMDGLSCHEQFAYTLPQYAIKMIEMQSRKSREKGESGICIYRNQSVTMTCETKTIPARTRTLRHRREEIRDQASETNLFSPAQFTGGNFWRMAAKAGPCDWCVDLARRRDGAYMGADRFPD